jgi:hypothetical protein
MFERASARTIVLLSWLLAAWTTVWFAFGYVDYLHDEGRKQACIERYGQGSEWVGDTNEIGGSIICENPDGNLKIVEDASALPMSVETFHEFLADLEGEL